MTTVRFSLAAAVMALAFGTGAAAPARADPVVLELFTSQGCNLCPPADALFAELSERPELIALAFHVDYWDVLGWSDPLAAPEHARRQKDYARRFQVRRYTPQMIVDGEEEMVGHERRLVGKAIRRAMHDRRPPVARVSLALSADGQKAQLRLAAAEGAALAGPLEAVVWLAGYDARNETLIAGGQNADRTLSYCNAVREWRALTTWRGESAVTLEFPIPRGDGGFAVLVQEGGIGRILGAAQWRYER